MKMEEHLQVEAFTKEPVPKQVADIVAKAEEETATLKADHENKEAVEKCVAALTDPELKKFAELLAEAGSGEQQPARLLRFAYVVKPGLATLESMIDAMNACKIRAIDAFVEVFLGEFSIPRGQEGVAINIEGLKVLAKSEDGYRKKLRRLAKDDAQDALAEEVQPPVPQLAPDRSCIVS